MLRPDNIKPEIGSSDMGALQIKLCRGFTARFVQFHVLSCLLRVLSTELGVKQK